MEGRLGVGLVDIGLQAALRGCRWHGTGGLKGCGSCLLE